MTTAIALRYARVSLHSNTWFAISPAGEIVGALDIRSGSHWRTSGVAGDPVDYCYAHVEPLRPHHAHALGLLREALPRVLTGETVGIGQPRWDGTHAFAVALRPAPCPIETVLA